jgi:hypothetical protein
MEAGFPKSSCCTKMPERQSIQYEAIGALAMRNPGAATPGFVFVW